MHRVLPIPRIKIRSLSNAESSREKPAGVVSPKLSRILLEKGAVSPPPAWIKKFEPTVTQDPMTVRKYLARTRSTYTKELQWNRVSVQPSRPEAEAVPLSFVAFEIRGKNTPTVSRGQVTKTASHAFLPCRPGDPRRVLNGIHLKHTLDLKRSRSKSSAS
ncbi:hypothetical protein AVEN_30582-1 [Araneus ventricosus]|uniref:Uncharacterized protein n=1 Tax=Araneus ventricosus TaxID=182803 RepID=A0A4Y2ENG8_ARAVE|nr:hypothetical protein AVEN_30582-1 [Araneus ventricosus]